MKRLLVVVFILAGCRGATATPQPTPTPRPTPAFDLTAVKTNFTDECKDPTVVDRLFCEQVKIPAMTADTTILTVPTTLDASATARARFICDQVAVAHFDGNGRDLGYRVIGVLDRDGGNAASCSV